MTTVSDIQKQAEAQGLPDANPAAIAFTLGFAAGLRAKQQRKLRRLVCQPQNYAWGRLGLQSKVAQMMEAAGLEVDPALPYAEYWFGTHAAAPSSVVVSEEEEGGRGASSEDGHGESPSSSSVALLSQWLVDTPSALGRLAEGEAARTGQLPFLLKVLSVAKALSIQAHPDKALAERLHAARPDVYKDDNHKPEMAVALTDFEAMCGFRPYSEIAQHLTTDYPELGKLVGDAIVQVRAPMDAACGTGFMKLVDCALACGLSDLVGRWVNRNLWQAQTAPKSGSRLLSRRFSPRG